MTLRYLSLFSGIEAATAAWHPLGWQCVGVSEIERFPCDTLAHHYPDVPNLGDVRKVACCAKFEPEKLLEIAARHSRSRLAATYARVAQLMVDMPDTDLMVFGSPCQDLSVAGKRKGLEGERSGLFYDAWLIAQWLRRRKRCRWALWENVPGAFTSNDGHDFAAVVGIMAGCADTPPPPPKGWGTEGAACGETAMVEWSTLDAQWFGVAQRRRRVFALADFGDWRGRSPVLLEPESLRGNSAPSREAGKGTAHDVAPCLTSSGRGVERSGDTRGQDAVGSEHGDDSVLAAGVEFGPSGGKFVDVNPTLDARAKDGPIRNQLAGAVLQRGRGPVRGVDWPADVAPTLDAHFGEKQGLDDQHINAGGVCSLPPPVAMCLNAGGMGRCDGESETLIPTFGGGFDDAAVCVTGDRTHAITAEGFDASEDGTGRGNPIVAIKDIVAFNSNAQPDQMTFDPHVSALLTTSQYAAIGFSCNDHGADATQELAPTMRAMGHSDSHANAGHQIAVAYAFKSGQSEAAGGTFVTEEYAPTLQAQNNGSTAVPCVAIPIDMRQASRGATMTNNRAEGSSGGAPGTGIGDAGDPSPSLSTSHIPAVAFMGMRVRRLTPRECERLQAFQRLCLPSFPGAWRDEAGRWWTPDYTLIPQGKKLAADGPRYKALGNSMCVFVMRWIGQRIDFVHNWFGLAEEDLFA